MKIPTLFVREDSIYKSIECCDCYDKKRDALTYRGDSPVIAHPPCRAWGRLRHIAKSYPGEKHLAIFAANLVRKNGGVLEHPACSTLWKELGLPLPMSSKSNNGLTIEVQQVWFGHKAEKKTWLYIVGCEFENLPFFLPIKTVATHCICRSSNKTKKHVTHKEREATPARFAEWLCRVAIKCKLDSRETGE